MNYKKMLNLLLMVLLTGNTLTVAALDLFQEAKEASAHPSVTNSISGISCGGQLRYPVKRRIDDALEKIVSHQVTTDPALEKLAILHKQHEAFDNQVESELEQVRIKYSSMIDELTDEESLLAVLKELQIDLETLLVKTPENQTIKDFSEINFNGLEEVELTLSKSTVNEEKWRQFIQETGASEEIAGQRFSDATFQKFQRLLFFSAFPYFLPQIRENLKKCVSAFCDHNTYKGKYGDKGYDFSDVDEDGFSNSIGIAYNRIPEILTDLLDGQADSFFSRALEEVKFGFRQMFQQSNNFSAETKEKICEAIKKIPINGSHALLFREIDGLNELEIKDNFLASVIELRRIQKRNLNNEKNKEKLKLLAPYSLATIGNMIGHGSIKSFFGDADSGGDPPYVRVFLDTLYRLQSIARIPGFTRFSYGLEPDEARRWMVIFLIAHEMGHNLDSFFKTDQFSNIDQTPSSSYCSKEEQRFVLDFKGKLFASIIAKCPKRTTWNPKESKLSASNELFADYLAYNAVYFLARKERYRLDEKKFRTIVTRIPSLTFMESIVLQNPDGCDYHPSSKIRFDGVLGINPWFYALSLPDLKIEDTVYFLEAQRLVF